MRIASLLAICGLVALCSCGPAAAPPAATVEAPTPVPTAAPAPATLSARATCARVPRDSYRGSGSALVREGVSAYAAFAEERSQPPVLVLPVGDEHLVCTPSVTPRCRGDGPSSGGGYRQGQLAPELGVLRAVDGAATPVLRYRTEADAFGPEIVDAQGSRREAVCTEGTEWIWAARPEGAVLLAAPTVAWRGGGDRRCLGRVTSRIDRGLLCFDVEAPSDGLPECEGIDLPSGCFAVSGDRLVQAEPGAGPFEPTAPHPWVAAPELPVVSPVVAEAAIAKVESAVVGCLTPGQRVSARLVFPGDGTASVRQLQGEPPLGAPAEACVRDALGRIAHPPFRGRLTTTAKFARD